MQLTSLLPFLPNFAGNKKGTKIIDSLEIKISVTLIFYISCLF